MVNYWRHRAPCAHHRKCSVNRSYPGSSKMLRLTVMEPVSNELSRFCTAKRMSQHQCVLVVNAATRGQGLTGWAAGETASPGETVRSWSPRGGRTTTPMVLHASLGLVYILSPSPCCEALKDSAPRALLAYSVPVFGRRRVTSRGLTFVWGAGIERRSLAGFRRSWDRGGGSQGTAAMLHPEPVSQLLDL